MWLKVWHIADWLTGYLANWLTGHKLFWIHAIILRSQISDLRKTTAFPSHPEGAVQQSWEQEPEMV